MSGSRCEPMMMEALCGLKLPTKRDKNGWNNNAKIKKRFYFLIATDDKQTKKSPLRTIIIIFVPSKVVRGERGCDCVVFSHS